MITNIIHNEIYQICCFFLPENWQNLQSKNNRHNNNLIQCVSNTFDDAYRSGNRNSQVILWSYETVDNADSNVSRKRRGEMVKTITGNFIRTY